MTRTLRPRLVRHRLVCVIAACCAIAAPALTPALAAPAAALPARVAPAITTPAAIHLTGTQNTRTFANYRTTDGHAIRALVIRSDNLSKLTPADARTLADLHVTSIIDFRTQIERAAQPDRPVPGASVHDFDVLGASPVTTLVDLPSAYRAFVTDPGANRAFRNTLLEIKNVAGAGNTVLYHCTAGKDRTGWASAVLLTILGVDRTTVEQDYLASNTFRHTSPSDPVNGVNIAWLRTSFATANQVYGSFDNYVHRGLGLTDADIAGLKKALLV